jgi:solute carrier family 13 (sodium-dependent dicarboxylate transporter), member 2/3/5
MKRYTALFRLLSGPLSAFLIWWVLPSLSESNPLASRMAGIAVWVAVWWLTEAVHLSVTALLPFVLLPLLGVLDTRSTAMQYMDQVIFLFIGGFIIAFAIERWELHRRLAFRILSITGTTPSRILAGVMLTSFLISMWVSNTATVMMLISAVMAVLSQTDGYLGEKKDKVASALLTGLAYSASIGGMATLVGTPTNMIFLSFYQSRYPGDTSISFTDWIAPALPLSIALLFCTYLVLRIKFLGKGPRVELDASTFKKQYAELGPMRYEEKLLTVLFCVTALLWFFRADLDLGGVHIPGWSGLFAKPSYIQDSTVAVLMALLLFLIPSRSEPGNRLITWEEAKKLPFGIILLFGSGFALAKGFEASGLSDWLAGQLVFLKGAPTVLLLLGICALVTALSEFASNVASIQLFLPVLAATAAAMELPPLMLLLPATFAASSGFMLPVATAPNTIVFGTGRVKAGDMMRAGLIVDILAILLITAAVLIAGKMGWWKI